MADLDRAIAATATPLEAAIAAARYALAAIEPDNCFPMTPAEIALRDLLAALDAARGQVVLPEPAFRLTWCSDGRYRVNKPRIGDTDCYTAEQMRALLQAPPAALADNVIESLADCLLHASHSLHNGREMETKNAIQEALGMLAAANKENNND